MCKNPCFETKRAIVNGMVLTSGITWSFLLSFPGLLRLCNQFLPLVGGIFQFVLVVRSLQWTTVIPPKCDTWEKGGISNNLGDANEYWWAERLRNTREVPYVDSWRDHWWRLYFNLRKKSKVDYTQWSALKSNTVVRFSALRETWKPTWFLESGERVLM